jgi:putative NADH-flavin reductase
LKRTVLLHAFSDLVRAEKLDRLHEQLASPANRDAGGAVDPLTSGMLQAGIRRVVVESTAFLFKDSIIPPTHLFGRLFFPDIVRDACEMENVFRKSGLDWTIVRPPRLTDKPLTGEYRVQEDHLPRFGFSVSRADVADFMIKAGEKGAAVGKVVGVSN